jgi:hypothetical protein
MCLVLCRLYQLRGGQKHKKRTAKQSMPSIVREKFFNLRRVLKKAEAEAMVARDHSTHHDGHNPAEVRLNEHFVIFDLRAKIGAVGGNNCTTCASHEPVRKKPVEPILTSRKGQLVMFDLTKFYVEVTHAHKYP